MTSSRPPRRALADRDVNKPTTINKYKNISTARISSSKDAVLLTDSPSKSSSLVTKLSPASPLQISVFDPKTRSSFTFPMCKKRSASVLDHGDCEESPRKNFLGNLEPQEDVMSRMVTVHKMLGEDLIKHGEAIGDVEENEQIRGSSSAFTSPSSFNTTILSQSTAVTEPEVLPVILPTPHTISQEARENANTLRLRLRVAMYKVRTNQTDIPLSGLKIHLNPMIRSPLKSRAILHAPMPSSPPQPQNLANRIHASQLSNPISTPSSPFSPIRPASSLISPSIRNFATPILPRIQVDEGFVQTRGSSPLGGRSHHRDLKGSAIEGRAADGLLSLKEMR